MRRNRGVHPYPQTEQRKNHLRKKIREKSVHKGNSSASGAVEIRYMYMNMYMNTCYVPVPLIMSQYVSFQKLNFLWDKIEFVRNTDN